MRALILAAGFGTRLEKGLAEYGGPHGEAARSFVTDPVSGGVRQKGLVTVAGRALVDYQLEQLQRAGIERDNVYVHTNDVYYAQFVAWADRVGIPIRNVFNNGVTRNEERLEQMGDLLLALRGIGGGHPVLVMASDTLVYSGQETPHDLSSMVAGHREDGFSRVVIYQKDHDLSRHGIIEIGEDGLVIGFEEKPEHPKANNVNASIYLLSAAHVERMITDAASFRSYRNPIELLAGEFKVEQVASRFDLGTIDDVLRANGLVE